VTQDIREYQALGVSHFIFDLTPPDVRGQLALMERFADEVRPKTLKAPPKIVRVTGRDAMTKRRPAGVPFRARALPAQSRRGGGLGRGAEPPSE
jgi:hypothetical protein